MPLGARKGFPGLSRNGSLGLYNFIRRNGWDYTKVAYTREGALK